MSEKELLELLVKEVQGVKQDVQGVKQDVQGLKQEMQEVKQDVQGLKQEMQEVKLDVQGLKQDNKIINEKLDTLDEKFNTLENEVKQNTITLDTTVQQCIEVIGDGYQANFEKMENLHIDSMRSKITQLELLYKLNVSEINRLKARIS